MTQTKKTRIAKISAQMQVRIPRDLFDQYGFGSQAEVVATKTGVEFRPIKSESEKCADLLENLVDEGLAGEELVRRFREQAGEKAAAVEYSLVDFN